MKKTILNGLNSLQKFASMALVVAALCHPTLSTAQQGKVKPPKEDINTAVMTNNLPALKQHLAAKTNLNAKDPMGGSTPLIMAALFGRTEMAKLLINAGANINLQNNEGSTALHISSFFCRPEIVKLLLQKKANKAIKNTYGSTAYESVKGPFTEVKPVYEMMGKMLGPMGLKLDYAHLEKTRPVIAAMLK